MSGEASSPSLSDRVTSLVDEPRGHRLGLVAIVLVSAFFNLFRLTANGYGNPYYAAAVKNMRRSWHNFFFVSFDAGYVSVDKPPLGLWIQTASTWVFGFHGWSLLLPQAIAGILSVVLLYFLVRRVFGSTAGLAAALVLALTPIVVATSRNNTADMLLVLTVLIATWLLLRASETGSLWWLAASTAVVGIGFNIKMMEAYLVLPAFYLVYLLGAQTTWPRRIRNLSLATVVLAVVSFSWATVVQLTPASARPYVGSTQDNSIFSLIFGYNGIERLTGMGGGSIFGGSGGSGGFGGGGMFSHGAAGPLRLFDQNLAGQIAWLIPLAIVGALVVGWRHRGRLSLDRPLDRRQRSLVLWGTWFLTAATFFSVAGFFHRYYMVMLSPALAALVGTAAVQAYILSSYPTYSQYLTPVVVGFTVLAALVLAAVRVRPRLRRGSYTQWAAVVGVLALLIAPTAWAVFPVFLGTSNSVLPAAGPQTSASAFGGGTGGQAGPSGSAGPGGNFNRSAMGAPNGSFPRGQSGTGNATNGTNGSAMASGAAPSGGGMGQNGGTSMTTENSQLLRYLLAHQGNATYLFAADAGADSIATMMLHTDQSVISLGGFSGSDPVMSNQELAQLVQQGKVKYVLLSDRGGGMASGGSGQFGGNGTGAQTGNASSAAGGFAGNQSGSSSNAPMGRSSSTGNTQWVENHCTQVSSDQWSSSNSSGSGQSGFGGGFEVYNCSIEANT